MKQLDVNLDVKNLKSHVSKEISDSIRGRSDICDLTVGLPSYGIPNLLASYLREELRLATGEVNDYDKYADAAGYLPLREAISKHYHLHYQLDIDPNKQILITNGAADGIWTAIHTLTKYGDDILIPDPAYILYESISKSLGRNPIRIPTFFEDDFLPLPPLIKSLITPKTSMIILNSPANPTGKILPLDSFKAICQIAKDHSLFLLHDEVFDTLVYRGKHTPAFSILPSSPNILMVNSISKRFGMGGWRLGWLAGHPDIIKELVKAHTFICLSVHTLTQKGMAKILNEPSIQALLLERTRHLQSSISNFINQLKQIKGFSSAPSSIDAGVYLLLNVESLVPKLPEPYKQLCSDGEAVAKYLLDSAKIAVVPGSAFGNATKSYVRLSLARGEQTLNSVLSRLASMFGTHVIQPQSFNFSLK
jgi:aspartate/methionine/tyrosine aminotransferase